MRIRPDFRILAGLLLATCLGACASVSDEPQPPGSYEVGDLIAPTLLEDQFGMPHAVDDNVQVILFARDMDGGKLIQAVLAEAGSALLGEIRGVYIADIHEMPGFISRTMAIPSMRKRSYPTLLDRTGSATSRFPGEPGLATVIRLEAGRIWEIEHAESAEALREAVTP